MVVRIIPKAKSAETLSGLETLIADARQRLASNPDFIALTELQKAHAEILRRTHVGGIGQAELKPDIPAITVPVVGKPPSQLQAALMALKQAGHPLTIFELVDKARALGAPVGGNNPAVNLGSTLSRASETSSIRWKGQPAWWFTGRALPPE